MQETTKLHYLTTALSFGKKVTDFKHVKVEIRKKKFQSIQLRPRADHLVHCNPIDASLATSHKTCGII